MGFHDSEAYTSENVLYQIGFSLQSEMSLDRIQLFVLILVRKFPLKVSLFIRLEKTWKVVMLRNKYVSIEIENG